MKKTYLLLLFSGIILRFSIQFIYPTFNGDEIALGNNIKYSNFIELLYPLKFNQSAPPLFLWLQKLIITISPLNFWINIKILSFISSSLGLLLFYIFIKKNNYKTVLLVSYIILIFNPFTIYNSLTVKQYTIDLLGILFLLVYFQSRRFQQYNWIFFLAWCLMSNIGAFACTGYLFYLFFNQKTELKLNSLFEFIKKNTLTICSPLPYVVYFIWFMKQKGAAELKNFMTVYWEESFVAMNASFFKQTLFTIHGLWIFIFNAFEVWGIFLMLLMIPFFIFLNKKNVLFKKEIGLLFYIIGVHLVLYLLRIYPFSDRLYLYITPLFILMLGSSLATIINLKKINKPLSSIYIPISMITLFLYFLYTPCNDNDVVSLYKKLNQLEAKNIYVTKKTRDNCKNFDAFTDNQFKNKKKLILMDSKLENSKYLISTVSRKIKMNETSPEEAEVQNLILKNKIQKMSTVNGFNIYKIN